MDNFKGVKPGLAMVLRQRFSLAVLYGFAVGAFKEFIRGGIVDNPAMHGAESFA